MATGYEATCRDCGHRFSFIAGPLMLGTRHTCQSCGETLLVPYWAPEGSYEMSREGLKQYLASGDFERDGREFTASERQMLDEIAANCPCGGKRLRDEEPGNEAEGYSEEETSSALHRCPACGSGHLDLEIETLYD